MWTTIGSQIDIHSAQLLTLTKGLFTTITCTLTSSPLTAAASSHKTSLRLLIDTTPAHRAAAIHTTISGTMIGMDRLGTEMRCSRKFPANNPTTQGTGSFVRRDTP